VRTPFLLGGNCGFVRRSIAGLAYPNSVFGEDFTFSWTLWRDGRSTVFLPDVVVCHLNRAAPKYVLRHQYWLGYGAVQYRSQCSPHLLRLLRAVPMVVFAAPLVVVPRIVWCVWRSGGTSAATRCLLLSPLLFVGHLLWCTGAFVGLLRGKWRSQVRQ
jgi:hypothetical protein